MSQYGHDHRSGTARHFTCLLSSLFPTFVRILQQCHIRILASGPQAVCLSAIGLDSLGGFSRGGNECVIYQKGMAVVALELTRMWVYSWWQVFSRSGRMGLSIAVSISIALSLSERHFPPRCLPLCV